MQAASGGGTVMLLVDDNKAARAWCFSAPFV